MLINTYFFTIIDITAEHETTQKQNKEADSTHKRSKEAHMAYLLFTIILCTQM